MTPKQFTESSNGEWLRAIIADPKGQALINTLTYYQPPFSVSEVPHIFAFQTGERKGFETCLKALVILSTPPKVQTEIEATYGVADVKPM